MAKEITSDKIWQMDQEIDNFLHSRNRAVFEIAKRLKVIRDERAYETLNYDTFESYVEAKGFRRLSTAYAYIHLYEEFVERLGFSPKELEEVPWYRLQLIAPQVKDKEKEEAAEWFHKAKELSHGDLNAELQEEKANVGFKERAAYPKLWRCKDCGKWQIPEELEICEGH